MTLVRGAYAVGPFVLTMPFLSSLTWSQFVECGLGAVAIVAGVFLMGHVGRRWKTTPTGLSGSLLLFGGIASVLAASLVRDYSVVGDYRPPLVVGSLWAAGLIMAIVFILALRQPPTVSSEIQWSRGKAAMAHHLRERAPIFWIFGILMIGTGIAAFAGAHTPVIRAVHGRVASYEIIRLRDGDSIRISVTGDDGRVFGDQVPERFLTPPLPTFLPPGYEVTVYYDADTQALDKSLYSTAALEALKVNDVTYTTRSYNDPLGQVTRSRLGALVFVALGGLFFLVNFRLKVWPLKPRPAGRGERGAQRALDLITGIVERKGERWEVGWVSDGPTPKSSSSPSLAGLIADGDRNVGALTNERGGELQYAIYPWLPSSAKVILDITESGDMLEAHDVQGGGVSVSAPDIESLVQAAERRLTEPKDAMLRWIKHLPGGADAG
jgi:hypothetical protein